MASPSAQLLFVFALAFIALLLFLVYHAEPEPDQAREMAMAAGAMMQAAYFAVRGRIPGRRRESTIRAVLNLNPRSAEQALNGPVSVAWGVRRFLDLAGKPFAEPHDEAVLREMNRFVRLARRLRRHPLLESALNRDLERIGTLRAEERGAALAYTMSHLAHELGEHEDAQGDRALAWFYGLRVAWLWRSLGGWRSPLAYVPRAVSRAAAEVIREVRPR